MVKKKYFKTKDECIAIFELKIENAGAVALVSEFNGWQPVEMKQIRKGAFRTMIRLPKEGRFQGVRGWRLARLRGAAQIAAQTHFRP